MLDTLELFPQALLDSLCSPAESTEDSGKVARAVRQATRHQMRRCKSEAHLADILPVRLSPGESWHVISHGDIDSLSYLSHLIGAVTCFDRVAISTWCMARPDLDQLAGWLDDGKIDQLDLYVGEIFPNQYGDEYARALEMAAIYGCNVVVARNHSKVMLMSSAADDYHLVTESRANVNTNPRIEQTAIHCSRELYDFYAEFFAGLKTIDRKRAA